LLRIFRKGFCNCSGTFQTARNYWKVLKNKLAKEGNESVTKCNRLKLQAADGKKYLTDVANYGRVSAWNP